MVTTEETTQAPMPDSDLVEVELTQQHHHRGILHEAGSRISVRPKQANWLINTIKAAKEAK